MRSFAIKIMAALFLCAAAGFFVHRAVMIPGNLWDFAIGNAASRAWVTGQNPYDSNSLWYWWWTHAAGLHANSDIYGLPSVSPPTALVVSAPIALLSPAKAVIAWTAFNLLLVVLMIGALQRLAKVRSWEPRGMLLAGATLLMAPLWLGLMAGQLAVVASALIVIAAAAIDSDFEWTGGLLLALAAAFKPQLGLPFILLYFFLRRPRVALVGLSGLAVVAVIGLVGLSLGGTPWWSYWKASLSFASGVGGLNDFDVTNKVRFHMLNLQLLFSAFTANRMLVNLLSLGTGVALAVSFVSLIWRADLRRDGLLILATAAPLCLLPVYHRYYDAILLSLLLAWLIGNARERGGILPWAVGIFLINFLTPLSMSVRLTALLPHQWAGSMFALALVDAHRVWAVLFISLLMLFEMNRLSHPQMVTSFEREMELEPDAEWMEESVLA